MFKCSSDDKPRGVCVFYCSAPELVPRKVKVSAVKHRFGCRLGLCYTHLVTFRFRDRRPASGRGHFSWTSYVAAINTSKMLRHRQDDSAKISVTWRRGSPRKAEPVYLPMQALIDDFTLETPPVFNVWFVVEPAQSTPPVCFPLPVVEEVEAEEDRDDPLWQLREEELYVGAGKEEDVPLVCDQEQRRRRLVDLGYEPPYGYRPLKEKVNELEMKVMEKEPEEPRQNNEPATDHKAADDSPKECIELAGEVLAAGKDGGEGPSLHQQSTTAVEGVKDRDDAVKNLQDVVRRASSAPLPPLTKTPAAPAPAVWRQRLPCVVCAVVWGVVLVVVLLLAALDTYLQDYVPI